MEIEVAVGCVVWFSRERYILWKSLKKAKEYIERRRQGCVWKIFESSLLRMNQNHVLIEVLRAVIQ